MLRRFHRFIFIGLIGIASSCSPRVFGTFGLGGPVSILSVDSQFTLSSPSASSTSGDSTPIISGTSTADDGTDLKFWVNNSGCTGTPDVSTTISAGAFTASGFTIVTEGLTTFHYTTEINGELTTACTNTGLSYTYQLPIYTFSRTGYTVTETGSDVGTVLTVTRDISDVAGSVTLTTSTFSAVTGTHFTAGSTIVNFAIGETSKTIASSLLNLANNGTMRGDTQIKVAITNTSGGTTNSNSIKFAHYNVIDDEVTGTFLFSSPIYSVQENAGQASVVIQRTGSTAAVAMVTLSFQNGSAAGGTDYTATDQLITFPIGVAEVTATIPITNTLTNADSKSFYAKLVSPSSGTSLRAQSVAKVRILDDDDSTTCDSSNTNTAINNGFGGGAGTSGDPYRVCNLYHLYLTRSYLNANFRIMADIDASPTLDADPNTAGTQSFVGSGATFTGSIFGHERIVYNFNLTTGASAATATAFFGMLRGSTDGSAAFDGVNFVYAGGYSTVGRVGIVTAINGSGGYAGNISNIFVNAYLNGTNQSGFFGWQILSGADINGQISLENLMTSGLIMSTGSTMAPVVSALSLSENVQLINIINTANHVGTGTGAITGRAGVIGTVSGTASNSATFNYLENRGLIFTQGTTSSTRVGGLVGSITASTPLSIELSFNYGTVIGSSEVGGLVGYVAGTAATTLTRFYRSENHGNVKRRTGGTLEIAGGILGSSATGSTSIDSCTNTGAIDSDNTARTGGILGQALISANDTSLEVTSNTNSASLTDSGSTQHATNSMYLSGIVGLVYSSGSLTGTSITISNNSHSGTITYAPLAAHATPSTGTIIGYLRAETAGTSAVLPNTVVISNNTSSGDINAAGAGAGSGAGGIIGVISTTANTTLNATQITISGNTYSGDIQSKESLGGIFSSLSIGNRVTVSVTGNTTNGSTLSNGKMVTGGIAGRIATLSVAGATGGLTFSNNSTVSATITAQGNAGGSIGYLSISNSQALTMSGNSVTGGSVESAIENGCFIGAVVYASSAAATMSNTTTSCAVNSTSSATTYSITTFPGTGGQIGVLSFSSGSSTFTISNSAHSSGTISSLYATGGIIGIADSTVSSSAALIISDSSNSATISSTGSANGGILGGLEMTTGAGVGLYSLTNTGTITTTSTIAGGISGTLSLPASTISTASGLVNTGTITASTNSGGLFGTVTSPSSSAFVLEKSLVGASTITGTVQGGFIGQLMIPVGSTTTIRNSYSLANLAAAGTVGGLVGNRPTFGGTGTLTLTNPWFRKDATYNTAVTRDIGTAVGLTQNKTDAQLSNTVSYQTNYGATWDFTNDWWPPGQNSSSYPTLR